jgi:hypothetical protein
VQPDWDWCHACGWDPEGLRPAAPAASAVAPPPPAAPYRAGPAPLPPGIDAGPGSAFAGYRAPPLRPGPPPRSGAPTALLIIIGAIGGTFLLAVLAIVAVTFLGTSAPTSTFASVDGAITLPEGDPAADGPSAVEAQNADLDAADWQTFAAADGSYRIDFPAPPVVENDPPEVGIITSETVGAELSSTGYVAFHLALSPDYVLPDTTESLNRMLDAVGDDADITLSSRTPGTFGFFPSLAFTGSVAGREATVQGVAFASERHVFALVTIAYDGVLVDHQRFVGSFSTG